MAEVVYRVTLKGESVPPPIDVVYLIEQASACHASVEDVSEDKRLAHLCEAAQAVLKAISGDHGDGPAAIKQLRKALEEAQDG